MKIYFYTCLFSLLATSSFISGEETTYFLSARPSEGLSGQTYVVPLKDPELIAHARDLVEEFEAGEPQGLANILSAEIKLGHANVNVDYSQGSVTAHRWHVSEVLGFGDATVGFGATPTLVNEAIKDEVPNQWIDFESGLGRNVFPSFTLVAELPFPSIQVNDNGSRVTWIGTIKDFSYPWVQHPDFGWIYPQNQHEEGYWIWVENAETWIFTRDTLFPFFYSVKDESWCYFQAGGRLDHWWYIFSTGEWRQNFISEAFLEAFSARPERFGRPQSF